jgi:hypothetical protein
LLCLPTPRRSTSTGFGALEEFYRGHGIRDWHVQVPSGDAEVEQFLARRGHSPGEVLPAMGITLDDLDLAPPRLAVERTRTQEELMLLNTEAFGRVAPPTVYPWHSQRHSHMNCWVRRTG